MAAAMALARKFLILGRFLNYCAFVKRVEPATRLD
jgi:hypothetical protein